MILITICNRNINKKKKILRFSKLNVYNCVIDAVFTLINMVTGFVNCMYNDNEFIWFLVNYIIK